MVRRHASSLVRVFTLEESNLIKDVFLKASETFERWGYSFIKVPLIEPWEDQAAALGERSGRAITFKDTRTGDLLSLRMDFTTQVVRTVVNLKELTPPLRVYYFGSVVSLEGEALHTGIELVGEGSLEGDAEVISAVYSLLEGLGIGDLTVSIGHVGVVEGILSSVEDREEVRRAFLEKNLSYLRRRFGGSPVADLPLMQGGREVLRFLDRLGFTEIREELERIGDLLAERGVRFVYDLSEIRELPYYTGVVFEVFHPDLGSPLAGGGRYDRLSSLLGSDLPSTGGTVYVDQISSLILSRYLSSSQGKPSLPK
jgi:ATP phosphoribosyltransferase regulatory subunit